MTKEDITLVFTQQSEQQLTKLIASLRSKLLTARASGRAEQCESLQRKLATAIQLLENLLCGK